MSMTKKIALVSAALLALLLTLSCCKKPDTEQTRQTEGQTLSEEPILTEGNEVSDTLPFVAPEEEGQEEAPVVFVPPEAESANAEEKQEAPSTETVEDASDPTEDNVETEGSTEQTESVEGPDETESGTDAEALDEENDGSGQYGDFF